MEELIVSGWEVATISILGGIAVVDYSGRSTRTAKAAAFAVYTNSDIYGEVEHYGTGFSYVLEKIGA